MSELNDKYMATLEELPQEDISVLRAFLAGKSEINDVDASPNTPFGDLMISPGALMLAIQQENWRRFFSDMDLENTALGETYNCDFLESYLGHFGLYNEDDIRKSYGIVRLAFEDSGARDLDQSTVFSSGDLEFRPSLPYDGVLKILNPADAPPASGNYAYLVAQGPDSWTVDVLIVGEETTDITSGTAFDVDRTITGLASATLLDGFQSGAVPTRLVDLAKRARFNTHSLSPNTRGGVINGINQLVPGVETIGCTISGDAEMTRDSVNPGTVAAGSMDVLVRGDLLTTETVTCRVNYIDTGAGSKFFGELLLPQVPILVDSIVFEEDLTIASYDLISVSADPTNFPALSATYGDKERLFVEFDMPLVGGNPAISPLVDESGDAPVEYAYFSVTYRYDPVRRIIADMMSGDHAPVGVRHYVRYFMPILVDTLNVIYNRKAGTKVDLATPRQEILTQVNRHTFYTPAGAPDVVDSMRYAGAHSVEDIEVVSTIRYSSADYVYTGTTAVTADILESVAYNAFKAEVSAISHGSVTDFYKPVFSHTAGAGFYGVAGPRNVSWLLATENLIFTENRTLG